MSAIEVNPPYPVFADIDGQPLEAGYIWIGAANLDPQTNPINVYWDAALTISAAQPIRTLGGYPSNSGTPARIYVNADYSIRVMNRNGSTIYSSLNDNAFSGSAASNATGTGSQTIFPVSSAPSAIFINGVYQNKNTYTFSGGNVTFSQAPPITSVIEFLV
jgi:hypothetical protein